MGYMMKVLKFTVRYIYLYNPSDTKRRNVDSLDS